MNFSEALLQAANEFGINLSVEQLKKFSLYHDLLMAWNDKINLTAIKTPQEVAVKHMIDSLSCYDPLAFPGGCSVIDVGTGAGFPGLPLKILRPDIQLTLLDSLNKRLIFLQEVIKATDMTGVSLVHARAEEAGRSPDHRERYQVALSRAVAKLNTLSELCLPFLVSGGFFIALKGAQYKEELDQAGRAIELVGGNLFAVRQIQLPGLMDARAVLYIQKVAVTPAGYPRRPGIPEKNPL